jgi:hypothetical protein
LSRWRETPGEARSSASTSSPRPPDDSSVDRSGFRARAIAAKVDWASLPSNLVVDARWYDSFGTLRGQVGPGSPADLADKSVIPVLVPEGYHYVLPGRYTFVVERLRNDRPVEVLGRRFVRVDRT